MTRFFCFHAFKARLLLIVFLLISFSNKWIAQNNLVTYAGNSGQEVFYDVIALMDGSFLVCGGADNLDWIDSAVPSSELNYSFDIPNSLGTNRFGFILHLNNDLSQILNVVHFPQGAVEDIRFMKTTNAPYEATGDLYISANTSDTDANDGGYVIAKLNGNFVDQLPNGLDWLRVVWAKAGVKEYHPWDVTSDGRVYYISGESHGYDWSAMYCLDQNGERMPVPYWRTHWLSDGTEWHGFPASSNPLGSAEEVNYSGIVLKSWGRCELRSWTDEDYNLIQSDGNGGTKKGKWPADILYSSPCDPESPVTDGPGYTGYSPESCCPVYGGSCLAVDRTTNRVYLGMNMKSYSVEFNSPDFEPAVIAMDDDGSLLWWSRLYHEITPEGDTMISLPDQYIDALSIDYANGQLVVGARAHGNNTENFWEGNTIAADPSAYGFQNQFTGTFGNIHGSWLGKLRLDDGVLMHSTYLYELFEGSGSLGDPHPDPNLSGWPDPNTGWPDLNTTRMAVNNLKTGSNGDVCVLALGRRTLTTQNAHQQNLSPYGDEVGCWNSFVRVYDSAFHVPKYSSLVVGQWDPLTGDGGGNTQLYGVWKTTDGVIAVGKHSATNGQADGNAIPVINVPGWGSDVPENQSAILVHYTAANLQNEDDGFVNSIQEFGQSRHLYLFPNPVRRNSSVAISANNEIVSGASYEIHDAVGKRVDSGRIQGSILHLSQLNSGVYTIEIYTQHQHYQGKLIVTAD